MRHKFTNKITGYVYNEYYSYYIFFLFNTLIVRYVYIFVFIFTWRNFKLLSFGEEAEEDEEELNDAVKEFIGRPKSTHDVLKDPQLSSEPAVNDDTLMDDVPSSNQTSK